MTIIRSFAYSMLSGFLIGTISLPMVAGSNVNRINLEGNTLIPGFVDAHGHVFSVGVQSIAANLLPPPDSGVEGSQEPNGVAEENAAFEVMPKVLPKLGKDEMAALIDAGQGLYARYGHTTAQEGAAVPGVVAAFRQAAGNGKLNMDVVAYPLIQTLTDDSLMQGVADGKSYSNHFRIGGVKMVLDGSPQGKTAWLTKPYFVPPEGQGANYNGYPAMSDEAATAAVTRAFSHNWQVLAHTNGDAAIDQYLKAVRDASAKVPGKDRRPVMIHGHTFDVDSHRHGKAVQHGRTGLACADSARCFERLALYRMEHPVYPEVIFSHRHHDDEH